MIESDLDIDCLVSSWVLWCSGYHVCFTRRRPRVRTSPEPRTLFLDVSLFVTFSVKSGLRLQENRAVFAERITISSRKYSPDVSQKQFEMHVWYVCLPGESQL